MSVATAPVLLAALALDAAVGDPPWLWRRLPHPVVLIGAVIGALDRTLNRDSLGFALRRWLGVLATALLVAGALLLGWLLQHLCGRLPLGWLLEVVLVAVFLAQRSLWDHVAAVHRAFAAGGLPAARQAVSRIVGRDPQSLDRAGVTRAAIESLAENFSDGVVAPALWYLIGGLPGLLLYKAVNTADSMIGHRTPRHRAFGWASARLDDLLNLPASRLSALLLLLAAGRRWRAAAAAVAADAPRHRSPNAGWPEAAMAGALGLALAGPRRYGASVVGDGWMNARGTPFAGPDDIGRALALYRRACVIGALLVLAGCLL